MTVAIDTSVPPAVEQDAGKREAVTGTLAHLGELGWTRPAIRAALEQLGNPLTDSAVYRAQRDRVHTRETPIWEEFFRAIDDGKVQLPEKARKLKASDVVDRAQQAAKVLANLGDKPNATAMREALASIAKLLPTPQSDEQTVVVTGDPEVDEGENEQPEA